ncbi:hypothetical protein BU14_0404s0001 [Porphyra umbilicalis]|uniref:NADP-dependent oxidoreductase domain-containing protein n=1 Tax=Porphyra umbilicalis TaxID=2786 RepID=A0A1X6NVX4_PORUM|nr:hypothetical protein BU14_0404s0001 [Porphyra umbilicalis]|eukprot:OSX72774.1 hypothetical protein BU14_0404s0001 [Porphyra umbilicalis]
MPAKMVKLATGATFAANGFGTWKAEPGQVGASVKAALEVGYRHIDCAAIYTNEAEVGTVFNELFGGDDPTIRREDVWITSKAWNTCGSKKEVVAACRQSLADLQLDYLDEYLVHFPAVWDHEGLPITDATSGLEGADGLAWSKKYTLQNKWEGMEECHRLGLTKTIGVSNYSALQLMDLLSYAKVPPAVNQIEGHINNQRKELRAVCDANNIHVTLYSVLGSGKEGPLQDPTVASIATAHGVSAGAICLAWALSTGCSVLAKSVTPSRIEENFKADAIQLTADEAKQLAGLERRLVVCNMEEYWGFPAHV